MFKAYAKKFLSIFILITIVLTQHFCDTGVDPSPDPGILRITLETDPADTAIIIVTDTLTVSEQDSFGVRFFQSKVYKNENYAYLFRTKNSYGLETFIVNVIKRTSGIYETYRLYETYVPPQDYNRIQLGIDAENMRISRLDIPVQVPPDSSLLMDFYQNFSVEANQVTEVVFRIKPFQSVHRFKDLYYFYRDIEVVDVIYY
jgi:hypothetical protein